MTQMRIGVFVVTQHLDEFEIEPSPFQHALFGRSRSRNKRGSRGERDIAAPRTGRCRRLSGGDLADRQRGEGSAARVAVLQQRHQLRNGIDDFGITQDLRGLTANVLVLVGQQRD